MEFWVVAGAIAGIVAAVYTVLAYRKQRVAEAIAELRHPPKGHRHRLRHRLDTRPFNERFTAASGLLIHDQPAVRIAGVYALAALADDGPQGRQKCIDELCAYLRMPDPPEPGADSPADEKTRWHALRQVRLTIWRLISQHLHENATPAWHGCDFDFTGAVIDHDVSCIDARFSGGTVSFARARFSVGEVSFNHATFSGGVVTFSGARFSRGGAVSFFGAKFSGGTVTFSNAKFSGGTVTFSGATFSGGTVTFSNAKFSGGTVGFDLATFSDDTVGFDLAKFSGGEVGFGAAKFSGGKVGFEFAKFSGGKVTFIAAAFSGGEITFGGARLSGSEIFFGGAEFSGGKVDLRQVADYSVPPKSLPAAATGLLLPA